MQIGNLQKNLTKFDERGVTVVALSVDVPENTLPWAEDKGLTMPLASDPEQEIIGRFGLINSDVPELSLHAVYIVDEEGTIFYRKVARRRAYSKEFLDAIDYRYGRWPRSQPESGAGAEADAEAEPGAGAKADAEAEPGAGAKAEAAAAEPTE